MYCQACEHTNFECVLFFFFENNYCPVFKRAEKKSLTSLSHGCEQEVKSLVSSCDGISSSVFLKDGRLATTSFDGRVEFWDIESGCRLNTPQAELTILEIQHRLMMFELTDLCSLQVCSY